MLNIELPYAAFRMTYNKPVKDIKTQGSIVNPNNKERYKSNNFIWDTGATVSCLNVHIIKKLNLSKVSITSVRTASGENQCFSYYVDIILPHNVGFKHLLVTGLPLAEGIDALIGMDIISTGSFLFTTDTDSKKQVFEFSTPPLPSVCGYVEKAKKRNEKSYKKLKKANSNHPLLPFYKAHF